MKRRRSRNTQNLTRRTAWRIAGAAALAALSLVAVVAARSYGHLESLRNAVAHSRLRHPAARTDLPPEVVQLALRLGARPGVSRVDLRQTGQMWSAPGARPMDFSARQTAATTRLDYIWTADLGPGGAVKAADYYVGGVGGLEVRALGLVTLAHEVGTAEIAQGEALRYLAELPWNPDAILLNHELAWAVVTPTTLRVSHHDAAITFVLGADGLPQSISAPARVYMGKGGKRLAPWRGRFSDYAWMGGRRLPMTGEVAWVLDGAEFVYWRGHLTAWSAVAANAQ